MEGREKERERFLVKRAMIKGMSLRVKIPGFTSQLAILPLKLFFVPQFLHLLDGHTGNIYLMRICMPKSIT